MSYNRDSATDSKKSPNDSLLLNIVDTDFVQQLANTKT